MSSKPIQNENLIFFSNDNEWYKFRSHIWCHKHWHCITVLCAMHRLSTSYSTLLTEEEGGQNWTGQTWAGCGRGQGGQEQGLVVGEQLQPCLGFCLDSRLLPVDPGQPHLYDHQHENPPI